MVKTLDKVIDLCSRYMELTVGDSDHQTRTPVGEDQDQRLVVSI